MFQRQAEIIEVIAEPGTIEIYDAGLPLMKKHVGVDAAIAVDQSIRLLALSQSLHEFPGHIGDSFKLQAIFQGQDPPGLAIRHSRPGVVLEKPLPVEAAFGQTGGRFPPAGVIVQLCHDASLGPVMARIDIPGDTSALYPAQERAIAFVDLTGNGEPRQQTAVEGGHRFGYRQAGVLN